MRLFVAADVEHADPDDIAEHIMEYWTAEQVAQMINEMARRHFLMTGCVNWTVRVGGSLTADAAAMLSNIEGEWEDHDE